MHVKKLALWGSATSNSTFSGGKQVGLAACCELSRARGPSRSFLPTPVCSLRGGRPFFDEKTVLHESTIRELSVGNRPVCQEGEFKYNSRALIPKKGSSGLILEDALEQVEVETSNVFSPTKTLKLGRFTHFWALKVTSCDY